MADTNFRRLTGAMDQNIKCPYCGADYDIHSNYCPYCGNANEYGQEESYMDKLERIEDDLEEIGDDAEETYSREYKSFFKRIILPILIITGSLVFLVMAITLAYIFVYTPIMDKHNMKVQNEVYPVLNQMYEAGDFENLQKYTDELQSSKDKNAIQLYNWKHYRFLSVYNKYSTLLETPEKMRMYPDDDFYSAYAMWAALELCTTNWNQQYKDNVISERDYEYILEYEAYAVTFLMKHYAITPDDIDKVAAGCRFDSGGDSIDYTKVKEIAKDYKWKD